MGCPYTEEDIQLFHDNMIEEKKREDFIKHLPSCSSCRVQLQSFEKISLYIKEEREKIKEAAFLHNLENQILSQLEQEPVSSSVSHLKTNKILLFPWLKRFAAAATLIIGILGYWQIKQGKGIFMAKQVPHPSKACEVDYFYSDSSGELVLYNIDDDMKIIWRLDPQ